MYSWSHEGQPPYVENPQPTLLNNPYVWGTKTILGSSLKRGMEWNLPEYSMCTKHRTSCAQC